MRSKLLLVMWPLLFSPALSCSRDVVSSPEGMCCEPGGPKKGQDAANHHTHVDMSQEGQDMQSSHDQGGVRPGESFGDMDAGAGDMRLFMPGDMAASKEMGMAELPSGFERCDCDHPDAICKFNRCYLPRDCENLGCPDGFGVCMAGERCDCDGEWGSLECAPNCTTMEDCPHDAFCGPGGKCVEQPGCTTDAQCPLGMWCLDSICKRAGERLFGEACDTMEQCASGVCSSQGCRRRCHLDSDCPEGEACTGNRNICTQGEVSCSGVCPEETNCRGSVCEGARCNWTDDCVTGDCQVDPEYTTGHCLSNEQSCKPNEYRSKEDDPYCRIFLECERDEDCPSGYTCESNGWDGIPYHRNLCSRLP